MRKTIFSLIALAVLALANEAGASLVLSAHNQRSSSGTLSTLKWAGPSSSPLWTCTTYTTTNPCINPGNATLAAMGITPSTAVWNWNSVTGVLSMTGSFNTASTISSSGATAASAVIGDKVTDMTIDTVAMTTTAATYQCAEGNFLAGVGANGCLNVSTGGDFTNNSSAVYNVGGDANCVKRTIGGDDTSTGNVRTLATTAGGGNCDPGDGAFNLWTVLTDTTATGADGQLVISNGIATNLAGTNYLTFIVVADAADDGPIQALQSAGKNIPVMANDTDFADPVTVTIESQPNQGTVVVNGSGGPQASITITYTGGASATGADNFVYRVTDTNGKTDTATVTLNVLAGGANNDTATTTRNHATFDINVGGNDVGFADPVTITILSPPDQGGTAVPAAPGAAASAVIAYTPGTKAPGSFTTYTETFTYTITDSDLVSDTATVTVTVNNSIPTAVPLVFNPPISTKGVAPETTLGSVNVASVAGNSLGDSGTVTNTDPPKGSVTITGSTIFYTPDATFYTGTGANADTFDYTITDADGETATNTVTVTIANEVPAFGTNKVSTTPDTPATKTLAITAGNGPIGQHTVTVDTPAAHGLCELTGTSLTYTPDAGYQGSDSCIVKIVDLDGSSATGTVTISVTAPSTGGGGGVTSDLLPGGGGALDAWALSLLAAGAWLRRKRRAE